MSFWREVFAGHTGQASWMRVVATPVILAGLFIAVYAVITHTIDASVIGLVLSLVGPALGFKALQRGSETTDVIKEG
jgi:uncharacterized membrane protein HdeD (DUF308 family)